MRTSNGPSPDADKFFRVTLPPALENKLFEDFKTNMQQYFPFVAIDPVAGPQKYRSEHPFLFRACLAAASHTDPALQLPLGEDLLRYVGECMLVRGEKSLDLLQGLLVFVAW